MRSIAGLLVVLCSVPSVVLAQAAGPTPLEVARALGASDPDHAPTWADGAIALRGPAERTVAIDATGAAWAEGGTSVRLGLRAIGRGRMEPVVSGALRIDGPEARAVRGDGIEEWWRSLPMGIEHGVDLARRPAGDGELLLEVAVDGLVATLADEGAITLGTPSTPGALIYSGLEVVDAGGTRLPARLDVVDGAIVIRVDDRGARYPVSVDPVLATLEATLTGPPGRFGWSVSVSADGSRAAVASPTGGYVSVFVRTGTRNRASPGPSCSSATTSRSRRTATWSPSPPRTSPRATARCASRPAPERPGARSPTWSPPTAWKATSSASPSR